MVLLQSKFSKGSEHVLFLRGREIANILVRGSNNARLLSGPRTSSLLLHSIFERVPHVLGAYFSVQTLFFSFAGRRPTQEHV